MVPSVPLEESSNEAMRRDRLLPWRCDLVSLLVDAAACDGALVAAEDVVLSEVEMLLAAFSLRLFSQPSLAAFRRAAAE